MVACLKLAPSQDYRGVAPGAAARRLGAVAFALPGRASWRGRGGPPRLIGAAATPPSAGGSLWPPNGGKDDVKTVEDVPDVTLSTLARQVPPPGIYDWPGPFGV